MEKALLFEFTDQTFLPPSLRQVIFGILSLAKRPPFGNYNRFVADKILRLSAEIGGRVTVVELAAGDAPLTEELSSRATDEIGAIIPSDLRPNAERFNYLASKDLARVKPEYASCDLSDLKPFSKNDLYVCSTAFHHLTSAQKQAFLSVIKALRRPTLICESLRQNLLNHLFALLGFVPALLYPLFCSTRREFVTGAFWCWLFPVAPVIFCWDGLVSSLRIWTEKRWREELQQLDWLDSRIESSAFSQFVWLNCGDLKATSQPDRIATAIAA
jgi:hypothetical protein